MPQLQLELTRLIGKKELTFGCLVSHKEFGIQKVIGRNQNRFKNVFTEDIAVMMFPDIKPYHERINSQYFNKDFQKETKYEIIGHPATLSNLHRWLNEKGNGWQQKCTGIWYGIIGTEWRNEDFIPYDSSKDLLDQDEETLKQIIDLVKTNQ